MRRTAPQLLAVASSALLLLPIVADAQMTMRPTPVPVVTAETGVDVAPDFGVVLASADTAAIRAAVVGLASRPASELESMARRGWEWARAHHTRERFAAEYRRALLDILARFRPELARRIAA